MKILKETTGERISKNIGLFLFMMLGVIGIFILIGKFYHWDRISEYIYIPFAFTTDGIFSNDWMFVSSMLYSIVGIGSIIYFFQDKYIKGNKKRTNKWYYKMVTLTVVGVYGLFYITNPWYTLQTHPRLFLYQDGKNITNKEIYFFLTERYGFKSDLYKPFKTLEDSIEGLEFAMKIKEPSLYRLVFEDIEKFGYNNLLKRYNDDSFQLYFLNYILFTSTFYDGKINNLDDSLTYLKNILSIAKNNEIINLSNELLNKLNYASKLNEKEIKLLMDTYLKEYLDKIFNTKTIDKSIFL
ncbi:hypothetical protein EOM39_01100 [Candidatus Gracilibacteria bacterium]|nr:hypothetical protein [Candidatus Gracilibacteria bacterium]